MRTTLLRQLDSTVITENLSFSIFDRFLTKTPEKLQSPQAFNKQINFEMENYITPFQNKTQDYKTPTGVNPRIAMFSYLRGSGR